jgi:hypothetical protein
LWLIHSINKLMKKPIVLGISALVLSLGAVLSRSWAVSWPQQGFREWQTAFNGAETLLEPLPDLFWWSGDVALTNAAFRRGRAWSPVVVDFGSQGLPDPVVVVGRQNQLLFYRPNLPQGLQAGAANPQTGTVTFGGANGALTETGIVTTNPVVASSPAGPQPDPNSPLPPPRLVFVTHGLGPQGEGLTTDDPAYVQAIEVAATTNTFTVTQRGRLRIRKPVAGGTTQETRITGLTFADIGDAQAPLPLLFLTTADGQVVCVDPQAFKDTTANADVDPAKAIRWRWTQPGPRIVVPAAGGQPRFPPNGLPFAPIPFDDGMNPAVGRVPLDGLPDLDSLPQDVRKKNLDWQDQVRLRNREWLLFVADRGGNAYAIEAFGETKDEATNPGQQNPTLTHKATTRWAAKVPGGTLFPPHFAVPPVFWNGSTPSTAADGGTTGATSGWDDVVVFAGVGSVTAFDAQGNFLKQDQPVFWDTSRFPPGEAPSLQAGQTLPPVVRKLGEADGTTQRRWQFPEVGASAPAEGRFAVTVVRGMAAWSGVRQFQNSGAELANTAADDDRIFVRWNEKYVRQPNRANNPPVEPAVGESYVERLGALTPYGSIETTQPIDTAKPVRVTFKKLDGATTKTYTVPASFLTLVSDFTDTTRTDATQRSHRGRITITKPVGVDDQDNSKELATQDTVTVEYSPSGGSGQRTEQNVQYPSRRGHDVEPAIAGQTPQAGEMVPVSIGQNVVTIEEENTPSNDQDERVTRPATDDNYDPSPTDVTRAGLVPGMSVANDNIYFGARYRGRVYVIEAASLLLRGQLFNSQLENPQGAQNRPAPNDDIPNAIDPIGYPAIADGWMYVSYGNGYLTAFANFEGGGLGTDVEPPVGPFAREGSRRSAIPEPQIRLTDTSGNPITDEDRLRFDWGQPLTLTVTFPDTGPDSLSLATNPVRVTLRGPMGDLPPVTISPARRTANGNVAGVAKIDVIIPNATPSNPMTPGTPLLKEVPDVGKRGGIAHWEVRAEQIGTNWIREDDSVGPWEPDREAQTWNPARNTAPWIALNNPIALVYQPNAQSTAQNIALVERFATAPASRLFESKNGDPYSPNQPAAAGLDAKVPTVITLGTDPATGQQLLFAEHSKASPTMALGIVDRSDLGLRPSLGPLKVRVQLPKVTKLGFPLLEASNQATGIAYGSVDQNYPDDGPDGFFPSIPGERLNVVKQADASNAATGSVTLRGVVADPANPNAPPGIAADGFERKVLQPEPFNISVDVPRFQPDGIYATRARLTDPSTAASLGAAVPTPATAVNPRTPYRDYAPDDPNTDVNNPPVAFGLNDRLARVTVFVDANNNGRLDLQGNYREAFRTFAVQLAVRPDMRLQAAAIAPRGGTASRLLDLGKMWHGFETPTWNRMSSLDAQGRSFFEQYWKPFVLLNTGNVNLVRVKPEVMLSAEGRPIGPVRLPSDGVDPLDGLTLMRDPRDRGVNLTDPKQIYLRTSFDDRLQLEQGNYLAGGVWLQKARPGASSPGSGLYGGDPGSGPSVTTYEPKLTLNIPMGAPLGTYAGDVRFFNDRSVSIVSDSNAPLGFRYQVESGGNNKLLDRARDPATGQLAALEPFADPALTVKVRVTENVAAGSTADANLRSQLGLGSGGGLLSRTSPAAGLDLSNNRLLLFYSSNQVGLTASPPQPLQYDIFGGALGFDSQIGSFPFDPLPLSGGVWGQQGRVSEDAGATGLIKNTKPSFAQDTRSGVSNNQRAGYVFWHEEEADAPGQTRARLLYRRVTPNTGETQVLAPGGAASAAGNVRQSPRAAAVPTDDGLHWFVFWSGSELQKNNLFFSQSLNPEDPKTWTGEAIVPTSPSLATVSGASPYYAPETKTLWLFYTGMSQKIGRSDIYASKLDPSAIGTRQTVEEPGSSRSRRSLYGLLGFAPRLGEILRASATRTTFTAGGVDMRVNSQNPMSLFIGGYLPLPAGGGPRPGQPVSGLQLYLMGNPVPDLQYRGQAANDEQNWTFTADLKGGGSATVYVTVDAAAGQVRFSQPPARLAGTPQDPQVAADYFPGSLRLTTSDQGATGGVGFTTSTYEPSWYWNTLLSRQAGGARPVPLDPPVGAKADRLWAIWQRSAGGTTLSPTLYYKTFRPAVQLIHPLRGTPAPSGNFFTFQIETADRQDARTVPILQDVNVQDGLLFFGQEAENQKIVVTVKDIQGNTFSETHYIGWREEATEAPVPMDVSVNEGQVTAFPMLDLQPFRSPASPQGAGASVPHLSRIWLFWTSTRGSGSDIFHATIAPRLTPPPG